MERKTVLIVDDTLFNRVQLSNVLKGHYDVLQAGSGEEALALLREHADTLSAVLLDMMMPVKDGFEVLAEKAEDSSIAGIPVLAVSASSDTDTELRALNAGASDFLSRPVQPEIALRRIKLAIDQRELELLHIKNRIYEERQYAVDHDALTGIYSKTAFYRETQSMIDGRPNDNFTLVRWDIEKFKLINSLFGMEMGDRVLTAAAEALKTRMEGKGTYGRYEGDNFVACFPTGAMDAEWLVDDIAKQMNDVLGKAGLTQTLILAGGVYPIEDRNVGVGEMCDRAAMAMRTIKGDYARHVAAYDDAIRRQMLEEQDILDNMVHALENGEFEVYLQPVYSLSTERVASAEALVRWNRPGKGIVSPGVFIPLFEKNGFISRLDYQIWEQVCQILAYRKRTDATVVPISVNLSRKSLYDPNICDKITDLTKSYGVEPELFRIEITESAYMDNASQLIATVKQLQERGHTVLMDDFGSGYSSLNTLREIPVDVLKMDMKFMEGFERGGRVGTIMTSVLRMAKWLGIPVIAEGVETYEEYEFLRSIGCEYTQGFYLARPMTYEDFENHLSNDQAVLAHKRSEFSEELVNEIMGDTPLPHVFATLFDGIALFEFRGDGVEVLRATSGYFDLFGYDASTFRTRGSLLVDLISESDYNRLVDACHRAVEGEESPRASIEWPRGSGHRVMATVAKVAADMSTNFLVIMGFLRLPGGEG